MEVSAHFPSHSETAVNNQRAAINYNRIQGYF